ncbi:proline racemase family protein [Streptomyces malaysiensis subsp. malaysiensis]|uniref:proline racemase family protein n=1 Tax=Streptomyces TaxID=1883 RepID=UPI001E44ADC5|nr:MULTISPECIES: proline racemase family protein [Streptomyces]UHH23149.1 proline racemase family protein [Streptomyces sp. HNM0561]
MITQEIFTIDYHTGGEPFRIVTDVPETAGATVAERRLAAMADADVDGLRRLLCSEPRGHADMYGGFVVPPDDPGAHFGVLFWHKDGFSTACGHGTMALGVWAVESGLLPIDASGITEGVIDVPSGRVTAQVATSGSRVTAVDFVNVPSYVLHDEVVVPTSLGPAPCAISFGGALYAQVPAAAFGLAVDVASLPALIGLSREIKTWLNPTFYAEHPLDSPLSGIYGVIFFEEQGRDAHGNPRQRNVTVFADGEVDRSPCGSGTCARVATLHSTGRLRQGEILLHSSIVGSEWQARVTDTLQVAGRDAVLPVVTGRAFRTGEHRFVVNPDDDMVPGFVLR